MEQWLHSYTASPIISLKFSSETYRSVCVAHHSGRNSIFFANPMIAYLIAISCCSFIKFKRFCGEQRSLWANFPRSSQHGANRHSTEAPASSSVYEVFVYLQFRWEEIWRLIGQKQQSYWTQAWHTASLGVERSAFGTGKKNLDTYWTTCFSFVLDMPGHTASPYDDWWTSQRRRTTANQE